MKKKTLNSSTTPKSKPRKVSRSLWREDKEKRGDYTNQKQVPYETIKELFKEFYETNVNDMDDPNTRNLTMRRFFIKKRYLPRVVQRWAKKYPELIDYELGKIAIGDKREVGMNKRELSEKSVMWTMHNYLDDWKEANKYHDERAKAVKEEQDKNSAITVVMTNASDLAGNK